MSIINKNDDNDNNINGVVNCESSSTTFILELRLTLEVPPQANNLGDCVII